MTPRLRLLRRQVVAHRKRPELRLVQRADDPPRLRVPRERLTREERRLVVASIALLVGAWLLSSVLGVWP